MASSSSSSLSLNANAQPFEPLPKWPSNSFPLLLPPPHAPVMTHGGFSNFQIKPVYHYDHLPIRVRSSHAAVSKSAPPYYNERINMKAESAAAAAAVKKKKKKPERKVIWVPKKADDNNVDGGGGGGGDYDVKLGGNTSLMIKNIPNRIQRHELLQILDKHCKLENRKAKWCSDKCNKSAYDFVYLPMDFE